MVPQPWNPGPTMFFGNFIAIFKKGLIFFTFSGVHPPFISKIIHFYKEFCIDRHGHFLEFFFLKNLRIQLIIFFFLFLPHFFTFFPHFSTFFPTFSKPHFQIWEAKFRVSVSAGSKFDWSKSVEKMCKNVGKMWKK